MNPTLAAPDAAGSMDSHQVETDFAAFLEPYLAEADRLTAAMAATQRQIDATWPRLQREIDELQAQVCGSKLATS